MGTKLRSYIYSPLILVFLTIFPVKALDDIDLQSKSNQKSILKESEQPAAEEITFTLINSLDNQVVPGYDPIPMGTILDLWLIPPEYSIRANVPGNTESVSFDLDDVESFNVENFAPFSLFGDIEGNYNPGVLSLGPHVLTAKAYSGNNLEGMQLAEGTLYFNVTRGPLAFALIDAETDRAITGLPDGREIEFFEVIDKDLNIQTTHGSYFPDLKVLFKLSGPINRTWIEREHPYALFGDINGDFNGAKFPVGKYNLQAFSAFGEDDFDMQNPDIESNFYIRQTRTMDFFFTNETFGGGLTKMEDGMTYYLQSGEFAGNVSIQASVSFIPGSVILSISGPINHTQVENIAPYSLFGDTPGKEMLNARSFPEGYYTLTATPYSEPDGKGIQGIARTITFSIKPVAYEFSIIRIINVTDGSEIANMDTQESGTTVDAATMPVDNATILVNWECDEFETCPPSVHLELEGPLMVSRIENVAPYTLFGDIGGLLNGQELPVGEYNLRITLYNEPDANGDSIQVITRQFQIINSDMPPALKLSIFPNPTNADVNLETDESAKFVSGQILDLSGKMVMKIPENWDGKEPLDISMLKPGVYIVRIHAEGKQTSRKLIVN